MKMNVKVEAPYFSPSLLSGGFYKTDRKRKMNDEEG
jgi:hypothetical protein